jgi:hypothetical protein
MSGLEKFVLLFGLQVFLPQDPYANTASVGLWVFHSELYSCILLAHSSFHGLVACYSGVQAADQEWPYSSVSVGFVQVVLLMLWESRLTKTYTLKNREGLDSEVMR